jgi:hypothetical protein
VLQHRIIVRHVIRSSELRPLPSATTTGRVDAPTGERRRGASAPAGGFPPGAASPISFSIISALLLSLFVSISAIPRAAV